MRKPFPTIVATMGTCLLGLSAAQADKLIPIVPVPNGTATLVNAINNENTIVGDYLDGSYQAHAFFGTLDGQYTFFDFPNGNSFATGLSDDGYIVGLSDSQSADCPIFGCEYLRTPDGTVQPIMKHQKMLDGIPRKMISRQRFVGDYYATDKSDRVYAYGYYGRGAKAAAKLVLQFNTDQTIPDGYNAHGTVVGYFHDLDNGGIYTGFVVQNGVATAVNYPEPAAYFTYLEGINRKGTIAGSWCTQEQGTCRAFLFDLASNTFYTIDFNGAAQIFAHAINDAGLVVLDADAKYYIDCTKRKNCPTNPHAIDISGRWFPAPATSLHSRACRNDCLSKAAYPAGIRPMSAAALREAMKNDPHRLGLHPPVPR